MSDDPPHFGPTPNPESPPDAKADPAGPAKVSAESAPGSAFNAENASATFAAPQRHVSFAEQVRVTGRHPVVLFGTGESGKSTLLMSLVNCLALNDRRINVSLGERMFSRGDADNERLYLRAVEFYQRFARDFAMGVQLPQTAVEKPFFIPIDVRPSNGPFVRLAFLEGNGDWLREREGTGALYPDLKPEILDLLSHFGSNLSILYVAPCAIGENIEGSTRPSDSGLSGAIMNYQNARNLPGRDNHLFLLTKWDTYAEPLRDNPLFSDVEAGDVEAVINAKFPNAWARFKNLPIPPNSGRRSFMQYAAGNIVGGIVREPPPQHAEAFKKYPRIVWNWIYANALESLPDAEPAQRKTLLFRDLAPQIPKRRPLTDALRKLLNVS